MSVGRAARHVALATAAVLAAATALGSVGATAQLLTSTTTTPPAEEQPPATTTTTPPVEEQPTTSTTSTSTSMPTTSTTEPPPELLAPASTTTVPADAGSTPTTAPPPAPDVGDGDGGRAPAGSRAFPSELRALMNSVVRSPANDTGALLAALAPLQQHGLDQTQAAIVGFGRFPVAGPASFSHDWWFPRFGPGWRLHQGTDIFAPHGTPVRAPVDGRVKVTNGGLGGLSVYVVQEDATYWYMTHLAGLAEGMADGVSVTTGQVVGFVGASGNAAGGAPHLHFEVHPGGGGPIDPKPVLDQFIADALAMAPQVVDAYAQAGKSGAPAVVAPAAPPAAPAIARALSPRAALLWTNAVSPEGGALHLAEAEAARVASTISWDDHEYGFVDGVFEREIAKRYAAWWVTPLVHPRLRAFLPS